MKDDPELPNKVKIFPFLPVEIANDIAARVEKEDTSKGLEIELDWHKAKMLDEARKAEGLPPITRIEDLQLTTEHPPQ